MIDGAGQHVGDGLDAAMRMPGKALEVVVGYVVAEVVEEQERIDVVGLTEAEGAAQMHAGALHRGRGGDVALDGSDRHRLDLLTRRVRARGYDADGLTSRFDDYHRLLCGSSTTIAAPSTSPAASTQSPAAKPPVESRT